MSSDGRELLILASCARTLAESARRAGYRVTTFDSFGDMDTRRASHQYFLCRWQRPAQPLALLERCLSRRQFDGCIYGGGLESQPQLLESLRRSVPLWGNPPRTLARLGRAAELLRLLAECAVPHPESHLGPTAGRRGPWLRKRADCSGGVSVMDVSVANGNGAADDGHSVECGAQQYWQRKVTGRAYSLLFLADGHRPAEAGWNELLQLQGDYRYHGAVTASGLTRGQKHQVLNAARSLVKRLALRGLCGLDFIVADERVWIIDINPRPTATLELHDTPDGALIRAHIQACRRRSLARLEPDLRALHGQRVVYATHDGRTGALDWPDWCHDLPAPGTSIRAGEPVCSVHARSRHRDSLLAILGTRARLIAQRWSHHGSGLTVPLCA